MGVSRAGAGKKRPLPLSREVDTVGDHDENMEEEEMKEDSDDKPATAAAAADSALTGPNPSNLSREIQRLFDVYDEKKSP